MKTLAFVATQLRFLATRLGPYVMLEIVLPGGTLFALALFLYRRRRLALAPAS